MLRQQLVDAIVGKYHDAVGAGHGRVLFLSIASDNARTDLLNRATRQLAAHATRPTVRGGTFASGKYTPWGSSEKALGQTVLKIGEMVSSWVPFLGFLLQIYGSARELIELVDQTDTGGRSPIQAETGLRQLKQLLREDAHTRPVVYVIDDADRADGTWWPWFLSDLAREICARLRVVIIVALEGPENLGEGERDEPTDLVLARRLVSSDLAEWLTLGEPQLRDYERWLRPIDPHLAQLLYSASDGDATLATELWMHWRRTGAVDRVGSGDRWTVVSGREKSLLASGRDLLQADLKEVFGSDLKAAAETYDMLRCAAVEGQVFTADAVAEVLEWDRDDLIDHLDDNLVGKPRPHMLDDAGAVTVTNPGSTTRTLWRYRLVSKLYWRALLEDVGEEELRIVSRRLAATLNRLYFPEERLVARALSRLHRQAGDDAKARYFRRLNEKEDTRELLHWLTTEVLGSSRTSWTQWDYSHATKLLLRAGRTLEGSYPFEEIVHIYETALEMARRIGARTDEARALVGLGRTLGDLRKFEQAGDLIKEGLRLAQQLGDPEVETQAWFGLASMAMDRQRFDEAFEEASRALELARIHGEVGIEADAWHYLGTVHLKRGRPGSAREAFVRGLKLARRIGNRLAEVANLHQIASLDLSQGKIDEARAAFEKCLEIEHETGSRIGEEATWSQLGAIDAVAGRLADAKSKFERSVAIARAIGDENSEANNLRNLAVVQSRMDQRRSANENLWAAVALLQKTQDRGGEAVALCQLARLWEKRDAPLASCLAAISVLLIRSVGYGDPDLVQEASRLASGDLSEYEIELLFERAAAVRREDFGWHLVRPYPPEPSPDASTT